MATPNDLFHRLAELGSETDTHAHKPFFTFAENRELRGSLPGVHCNTLFFIDKKSALWLCVVEESRRMNIWALSDMIRSARLSFAQNEPVKSDLSVESGAVTLFALLNDRDSRINVILDAEIMAAEKVKFHPLVKLPDHRHRAGRA